MAQMGFLLEVSGGPLVTSHCDTSLLGSYLEALGEDFAPRLAQVIGRIQSHVVVDLRSPFSTQF